MILIANIGKRDVYYKGATIPHNNVREKSRELRDIYDEVKQDLSYPLLEPYLRTFSKKLDKMTGIGFSFIFKIFSQ